jgi:hypothetical protein
LISDKNLIYTLFLPYLKNKTTLVAARLEIHTLTKPYYLIVLSRLTPYRNKVIRLA